MKWVKLDCSFWVKQIKGSDPGMLLRMRNMNHWVSETNLRVLYSEDNTPKWGWLKHFSISRQDRLPDWDELLQAKIFFMGDIDTMMIMPKKKDYVNLHQFTFHVWQTPEPWGIR